MCSYNVATMKKPVQMQMEGYELLEKVAVKGGNSGRIYVPPSWIGKKVRVVLLE
jgi:putative transposon-encoded protein